MFFRSKLPPHHLIHHPHVALDDADNLRGDVLIDIVRHGDARVAVADEGDGDVDALEEAGGVDAAEDEATFVQGLRPFGRSADTDGWERMADAREEGGLLGQGARVGHHRKRVHLQAVVIMESQRLVLNHARVELEAGGFQPLPGARVAGVEDRHIVLRGHLVDGVEEAQEVLFGVDVLLAVGAQEDVLALLEAEAGVDVAGLDLRQVVMQHLGHRRTRDIRALLREARIGQVAAGVLAVGHIDIGDDIDNAAVRLLREALVLAAIAGLHVEDGDVQALGTDDAQAGVRVAEHQHRVGLDLHHQLVALGDDVAHRLAQVHTHRIHVHIRVRELQVLEEHAVQVVVIVLARMRQDRVEVLPALVDDRSQADNFRAGAHDDQKLQLPVILECCHIYFTGSK